MSFLGVKLSLANMPIKIPLLYKLVITRVWFKVSKILSTLRPLNPCVFENAGPNNIGFDPSKKYN